ncbi:MAG TPA: hypothetical protein VII02_03460 [Gemmatimonadaceae bacterium]
MARGALAAVCVAGVIASAARAQEPMQRPMGGAKPDSSLQWTLGAQAIGVVTRASPAHANRALTEGYLTQPMVMGSLTAPGGRIVVEGMLDFEGITLKRGELDAGMSGEGYIDRRHPHTYLHELVASVSGTESETAYSLAFGKGFVPYGSDDPMVRPFEKYPINHHISQIVERLLATAAVRRGPVLVEAARFNGDEPESPSDLPNRNRLWDSWAGRATLLPTPELEMQASTARVKSPEVPRGGGLDQRKLSVSLRYESVPAGVMPPMPGMPGMSMSAGSDMDSNDSAPSGKLVEWQQYLLVEWGRSSDYDAGSRVFSYSSMLAEGEVRHMGVAFAARLERTERPEEERLANPFRTPRPPPDFSILGRTRWDIATARLSAIAHESRFGTLTPFIEVARQHATALATPSGFDPRAFYGSDRMWSFSVGVAYTIGMIHKRTGGYGAAARNMTGMAMPGTVPMSAVSEGSH